MGRVGRRNYVTCRKLKKENKKGIGVRGKRTPIRPDCLESNVSNATCKTDECERGAVAHGWCLMHYKRWWRQNGGPFHRPTPVCSVESCSKPHVGKGYCLEHYGRWFRTGDPLTVVRFPAHEALEFYLAHVDEPSEGCRIWPYRLSVYGYGVVNVEPMRGPHPVHRMACENHWGPPVPPRIHAAHLPVVCHNRACWAWEHVRWATVAENSADRDLDGTTPRGEAAWNTKVTAAQVVEMRARFAAGGITQRALGIEYGMSQTAVGRIVNRKSWGHVL